MCRLSNLVDSGHSSTPPVPVWPVLLHDGVQVQPHCAPAYPHGRAPFPVPPVLAHIRAQVQPQEPLADTHGRAALPVSHVPTQLHPARCTHCTLACTPRWCHHPHAFHAALHALLQFIQLTRRAQGTHACSTPLSHACSWGISRGAGRVLQYFLLA